MLDAVEAGTMSRSNERRNLEPPTMKLRSLVAKTMLCKTAAQVKAALDAVNGATGTNVLAAQTVREAMQESLQLSLPDNLQQGGPGTVSQVKADLLAAGLPDGLVRAAFEDGRGADLPPSGVDAKAVAAYIGMQVSIAHVGKLVNSVRMRKEMVYGPAGNSGPGARATGAAGGNRRSAVNKLVINRLKQKRTELWAWVKQYNATLISLRSSVADWLDCAQANPRLPPPPVSMEDLPAGGMTNEQVRDPEWRPNDVGSTHAERVDIGFLDLWRSFRSHDEEAHQAGPAHAAALVACLAANHNDLARRIGTGLGPLLSQAPNDDGLMGDVGLGAALECSPRLRAISRHFTMSVLPPQVAVDAFEWHSVTNILALQAWKAALEQRMRTVHGQLTSALGTLSTVLPHGTGLHPNDHGVFSVDHSAFADAGQPAPAALGSAPPSTPPPPPPPHGQLPQLQPASHGAPVADADADAQGRTGDEDASSSTLSEQSSDADAE